MPQPSATQLQLTDSDRDRLVKTIQDDYSADSADLAARNKAMTRWYRLWRNAMDVEGFPEEERSSFSIPLATWNIKAKVAKEMDVLLGEESEIIVAPVGQSDCARADKVTKWMNWRVKNSLKLFKKLYTHILQKNIFGVSIAFVPWCTKRRMVKEWQMQLVPTQVTDPMTGLPAIFPVPTPVPVEKEVIDFDGPDVIVENLEDWIVPAGVRDFLEDHFIRRLWLSVDDILDLRDQGKVDQATIADNLEDLRRLSDSSNPSQDGQVSPLVDEKSDQHGLPTVPQGRTDKVVIHNWFGKFRLNVSDDGSGGDERSIDVVAFYQPELKELLGCCRLIDIFPDGRKPFIVSQAGLDVNSPWGIGLCEMLEPVNREMDAFHKLAVSAGEGSIGPVILYNPAGGFDPEKMRIEPFTAIPTSDPNSVKTVQLGNVQLGPYVELMSELQAFAERLTSLTDPQLGRQFSQPNAPRTLGQQQMLQAESNVNLLLDMRLERESLRELLQMIWDMDRRWLAKPVFFRVTESDPGDVLTDEDMQGSYDFDIGPITSISSRSQKMQELMQALALTMPIGVVPAIIGLLRKIYIRMGLDDVAALLPNMAALQPPIPPEQENARLMQGEDLQPNPLDDDQQHIQVHSQLLQQLQQELAPGITVASQNPSAAARIQSHIQKHMQAFQMKQAAIVAAQHMLMAGPQQQSGQQGQGGKQGGKEGAPEGGGGGPQQPALKSVLNQGGLNLA